MSIAWSEDTPGWPFDRPVDEDEPKPLTEEDLTEMLNQVWESGL